MAQFYNPVKLFVGKGELKNFAAEIKKYADKILILYGKASLKSSGKYDAIMSAFAEQNISVEEIGGISTPDKKILDAGVALCKQKNVQAIVGIGSATQMDLAKSIAFGAKHEDYWNLIVSGDADEKSLPVFEIPTFTSSGSEADSASENQDYENDVHGGFYTVFPTASLIDYDLTTNENATLFAKGALVAVIQCAEENYFSTQRNSYQERLALAHIANCIEALRGWLEERREDAREYLSLSGAYSTGGYLSIGREGDYSIYPIETYLEETLGLNYMDAMLATFPFWLRALRKKASPKYAAKVDAFCALFGAKSADCAVDKIKALYASEGISFAFTDWQKAKIAALKGKTQEVESTFGTFTKDEVFEIIDEAVCSH